MNEEISEEKKLLKILSQYRKPTPGEGVECKGRHLLFINVTAEDLQKGLKQGRYKIKYLGEFYRDYGLWGVIGTPTVSAETSYQCEKIGYYDYEDQCFEIQQNSVVLHFIDEFLREEDGILIQDHYVVLKQ